MPFPTILTVLTRADAAAPTLAAAGALALEGASHLDVLALGIDHTADAYATLGAAPMIWQTLHVRTEEEARAVTKAAEAALTAQPPVLRAAVETTVIQAGAVGDLIAMRARFADLVVLPRPYGEGRGPAEVTIVEAALFGADAPVLVLPEGGVLSPAPKRVLLAWNQSREALAAARSALPFLKQADHVSVTIVDPPKHGPERSDPGGPLCQWLARHGVSVEVTILPGNMPRVSDALMRHATDMRAELIVMGAYGHSRIREAILGGATRAMLEKASVPVLMAH